MAFAILFVTWGHPIRAASYLPLELSPDAVSAPLDLIVSDESRQRVLPVRIHLPSGHAPAPVVLFSHGLGGSREGSSYLGRHWAGRGYVVVFLQHPGSDEAVWRDIPPAQRINAMQKAGNLRNFMLRVKDVPAVLDQLASWHREPGHPLYGQLDLAQVGMAGHSFGAITAQAVSGQQPRWGPSVQDPRIKAAVLLSPSIPRRGQASEAFGQVNLPWLLLTGTLDIARLMEETLGGADLASRLGVYPALPAGGKYELVLHEAQHSAFTDRALPGELGKRNPNHHRAILAVSTAFWDAWLRADASARAWLDGDEVRRVLAPADRWQRK